jgi:hypothetical protein
VTQSVEVLNSDQAVAEFVRCLGAGDREGAFGFAQVVHVFFDDEAGFSHCVKRMIVAVDAYFHGEEKPVLKQALCALSWQAFELETEPLALAA